MEYNEDLQQFTFEMYQSKEKSYGIIAIIYYCVFCGGLFLAGILYQKGFVFGMNIIYCALFAVGVMIVLIKDKIFAIINGSTYATLHNALSGRTMIFWE